MSYIANPTEVLVEYLVQQSGEKPRMEFHLGRLSMALEIITVVKTLEDELVPMLSLSREEIISVLTTLLRDQKLADVADEWYDRLSQWRRPSFVAEPSLSHTDDVAAPSPPPLAVPTSRLEALREAVVLQERTTSQLGSDQSLALPSGESDEELTSESESTQTE